MPPLLQTSPSQLARGGWFGPGDVWVGGVLSTRLLVLLRWIAVGGQSATLLVAMRAGLDFPAGRCFAAVGTVAVSNLLLGWWVVRTAGQLRDDFFHIMLWDLLVLTFLLHWTGGLSNPFATFYLVHLVLAGVTLRTSAVGGLALATLGACAWLWVHAAPPRMLSGWPPSLALMLAGTLSALAAAGAFTVAMLLALRGRSRRLLDEQRRLRQELADHDRFLTVSALATGFAHELGTPVGTIRLAAEELHCPGEKEIADRIRGEASRCADVLRRLRELGAESDGLADSVRSARQVVEEALGELPGEDRRRIVVAVGTDASTRAAGLPEALLVLLRNALRASPQDAAIQLRVVEERGWVALSVQDRGPGFSEEMRHHGGEPFRSDRQDGTGLGLGLFFARRLAAASGGELELANAPSGGAVATLRLPAHPPAASAGT